MSYDRLFAQPHVSVISGEADFELRHLESIIQPCARVGGRMELDELLGRLLEVAARGAPLVPKTLDLIGHTRGEESPLVLGDWHLDAKHPTVGAFFRELADQDVLPRLGVRAVRLLGCRTAETNAGRTTICGLADMLGVEVLGTRHLLYDAHYGPGGFREKWQFLLVSSCDLRRSEAGAALPPAPPYLRDLDLDRLPAVALADPPPCARRFVTTATAREILQLIRRSDGAQMPGLLAAPECELAWPAGRDAFHIAHVFFDGAFLRFYPEGFDASGVLYPTSDIRELRTLIDGLPLTAS